LCGAESLGGGIKGIVKNFPNTLPWLILLIAIIISYEWGLFSGLTILIIGIFTIFFFNALKNLLVLLVISIPLIVLARFRIIAWYLDRALN